MKTCKKCGAPKEGVRCNPCEAERARAWRAAHADLANERRRVARQRTIANGATIERLRECLTYDAATGALSWLQPRHMRDMSPGGAARRRQTYLIVTLDNKQMCAHRVAWALAHGAWPTGEIDHINGDPLDNRLCNLRDTTRQVNAQNQRRPHKGNAVGFLGVRPSGARFAACISVNREWRHLGTFPTAEEAHHAYVDAKRRLHEGCTI
jgi:hypothetical protein